MPNTSIKIKCEVCEHPVPIRNKRFCSQECSNKKPTNYWVGKHFSREYREKLSQSHIGIQANEKSPTWKGTDAKYATIHQWVARKLGKPKICSHCFSLDKKKYEWANISGLYLRDLDDWIRLCTSCHFKFDQKNGRRNA